MSNSFNKDKLARKKNFNIQDTAFLLRILSKAEVKLEDMRQAEITVNKIKTYHERLMDNEINPIGK